MENEILKCLHWKRKLKINKPSILPWGKTFTEINMKEIKTAEIKQKRLQKIINKT